MQPKTYNQAIMLTAFPSLEFAAKKTAINQSTTMLRYGAALAVSRENYENIDEYMLR